MRVSIHSVTDFFTNCYVVQDEGTGRTAIIDPGELCVSLREQTERIGAEYIDYILLTHCHLDHIGGAAELHRLTGAPVVIHADDADGLADNFINGSELFGMPLADNPSADIIVNDGDSLELGDLTVKVMHTPGHTCGSVCYLVENSVFSGDTLFRMSCGRTDLPTGSGRQIADSLKKLAALDGDRSVYPGHGEKTSLENERKRNVYINDYTD